MPPILHRVVRLLTLLVAAVCVVGCGEAADADRTAPPLPPISAAASTRPLLEELCALYAKEQGVVLRVDAASSSTLARQIEQGKPFALFVSAHPRWTEYLLERGIGEPASACDWLQNRLVWIRHVDAAFELGPGPALPPGWSGRLALGDPDHVPAGIYAKEALQQLGLWSRFRPQASAPDAPMIVPAADVSAALRNVSSGQCETGIVYASDAKRTDRVAVVHEFAAGSHTPIRYPLLLPKDAPPAARAFVTWLGSERVREIVRRHGFEPATP